MADGSSLYWDDRNIQPKDGDKSFDRVIWGHTQIETEDPLVLIHFTICHGFERYMKENFGLDLGKDSFLNALTDAICLREAKKTGSSRVAETWKNPKKPLENEIAGLRWLKQIRIKAFKAALEEIHS